MKFRILILLIILWPFLIANPVQDITHLSELQIIEPNNWRIEICDVARELRDTDSLVVESLSGRAKVVRRGVLTFVVINQDCLSDSLTMSRDYDLIKLYYYFKDGSVRINSVRVGNYPGSYLHNIRADQSVCRWYYDDKYFKNNTPSFGNYNTLDDHNMGLICGTFVKANGEPLKERTIYFDTDPNHWRSAKTNRNGYYSIKLESRYYEISSLYIEEFSQYIRYQTQRFDLEPDDTLRGIDFIPLVTSIKPVIKNDLIMFNNYPHPASNYTWFVIDNTEIEASAMRVNVYALNGRKVDSFIPSAYQCRYDCSKLAQGSYIMTLQHGREVLATKKLQILK